MTLSICLYTVRGISIHKDSDDCLSWTVGSLFPCPSHRQPILTRWARTNSCHWLLSTDDNDEVAQWLLVDHGTVMYRVVSTPWDLSHGRPDDIIVQPARSVPRGHRSACQPNDMILFIEVDELGRLSAWSRLVARGDPSIDRPWW